MGFAHVKLIPHHPEPHLPNVLVSDNLDRSYSAYYNFEYPEKDTPLLERFYDTCEEFFSQNKKFNGLNKEGEHCILGFKLCYYNRGGAIFEPIIYNLDKSNYVLNYKKMGLDRESAKEYNLFNYDCEKYKRLENILFVFADNKKYYHFNFHKNNLYNDLSSSLMTKTLKSNILKNYLEDSLPFKSEQKAKIKI